MKYDCLKETPTKVVTGVKFTDKCFAALWREEELTLIMGFPACPECGYTLLPDWMGNTWDCLECGTVWTTLELVQAIENEHALVTVSIRNLTD